MLTKDNFKELLYEIYDGNIEPLEEYVNANTSIKFFCHFKKSLVVNCFNFPDSACGYSLAR